MRRFATKKYLLGLMVLVAWMSASYSQENRGSVVILHAQVADGTGKPLRPGNVRIVGGRIAWAAVATATGIVNHPVVPVGIVAAAVVGAVLVANLMAFVMARPLARVAPAVALRTE